MEQAVNTFGEGLVTDYNPLLAPENTLTDALNATFVTMNGNEVMLQNDMGNGRVETAFLPSGFVPVGIKEHGGIIYVASHNPLTGESLIGSFPSPERNIDEREVIGGEDIPSPSLDDIVNREYSDDEWYIYVKERKRNELIQTTPLFNGKILNPGDKFAIVIPGGILYYKKYLSHCYNTEVDKVESPKLSESEISVLVLDSTKNLSDITDTLIRSNEDDKDLSQHSEEFKRNYKYFIWDDFNAESDESNYFNNNAKFENTRKVNSLNLNTYLNKFSGSLFLSRKYSIIDHIECSNIDWKPTKSSNPTVVNGTLSFDLIYYYNCPDGFYLASNLELHPIIKWKKGNWKIEEANSPEGSVCSSSVNLNFDIPDQDSYEYCPKYDISTGLYKFIIPYKIGLKLENGQLIIKIDEDSGKPIILISDNIKTKNNNDAINKVSDYNYITWIGQYYNYSVIQGSNIKMNYNNGIGEFIITPKMYYSKPLEDLAISFTLQLLTDITPEPVTPVTGEWGNSDGFGYVWAPSKYNQNNDYVFLFKESYFEKENDLYKYKINLRLCLDFKAATNPQETSTWEWQNSVNILDAAYVWDDTGLTLDNEKVFVHWHNIGPNDYFGYVEIINSVNEVEEKFWIFPRNIVLYNYSNPTASYKEDGAKSRKLDTFDSIYTKDNKLVLSYYPPGGNVTVIRGNSSETGTHLMFKSKNTYIDSINLNYVFSRGVPQSICKALSESISGGILNDYEVQIVVTTSPSSSEILSITLINDYFYPLYKFGSEKDRGTEEFTLNLDDDDSETETIDVILNPLEGSNFIKNLITLKFKLEVINIDVLTEGTFNFTKNDEKEVQSNTITEIPSNNYTKVN